MFPMLANRHALKLEKLARVENMARQGKEQESGNRMQVERAKGVSEQN